MKISLNWLKDFVDIPKGVSPKELGERLTVSTVEVAEVIDQAKMYEKMVVGEIKQIQEQPQADRLKVCIVDVGRSVNPKSEIRNPKKILNSKSKIPKSQLSTVNCQLLQIVCGAKNLYEGMKCAVAMPGAKIRWHGEGDLVELKKVKLRGVESQGMILAARELPLEQLTIDNSQLTNKEESNVKCQMSSVAEGVMDLKDIKAKPGTPLAEVLGLDDMVIEIDNKSLTNRPDLWGHHGLAREISAIYGLKFQHQPEFKTKNEKLKTNGSNFDISIQAPNLCRRFTACLVENVKIEPSPGWMQARLRAVGLRSINNIVDITNYVMLDVGQPTHAFDADKITENTKTQKHKNTKLVIRKANRGETITTLDGVERKLEAGMLVVANNDRPVSLAGIIGGTSTQVTEDTKNVVFEAANWDPLTLRRTALDLGVRTDASMRFDKGVDPERAVLGMRRILKLTSELIPSATIHAIEESFPGPLEGVSVKVSHDFLEKRIGHSFKAQEIIGILERLGFTVKEQGGEYQINVPSWRATGDVSLPEDIMEEVARIHGYNNLKYRPPVVVLTQLMRQPGQETERVVKTYLSQAGGMHEIYNYPWIEQRMHDLLQKYGMDGETLELAHPPTPENKHIARFLLHNLLLNVETNLRFRDSFRIFELARIFKPSSQKGGKGKEILPDQPKRLVGLVVSSKSSDAEIYAETKGIVEGLLGELRLDYSLTMNEKRLWLEPGASQFVQVGKEVVGGFGLLRSEMVEKLKIEACAGCFYFDYDLLVDLPKKQAQYEPIPEYPVVTRDLAVEVESRVRYADMEGAIGKLSKLLEKVELFDVYEGEQIGKGKRSLAWHLSFRDPKKTLTSEEADKELDKIVQALKKQFGAVQRA